MIHIVHPTWIAYGPLYLAREEGLFERYGLAVELEAVNHPDQAAARFETGEAAGLGTLLDREVIRSVGGAPGKIVLALAASAGWDGIAAGHGINMVPDLVGRSVAVDPESAGYFFLLSLLERSDVAESDLDLRHLPADEAGRAFLAGDVDAAVTWQPWLARSKERGGGHLLADSRNLPKTVVDVLVLRDDLLARQPEAPVRLARAWFAALAQYRSDPAGAVTVMAKMLELAAGSAAEMAAGVAFFDAKKNLDYFDPALPNNIFEVATIAARFWRQRQRISREPALSALIARRYIRTAAR